MAPGWLHLGTVSRQTRPAAPNPAAAAEGADATLLQGVREGDPAAIEALLERAQGVARRYSRAVCGRAPDSEDAMQEALLRTFRHAGEIREPRAFRAWLYRTVKNACLLGRRRGVAEPGRLESLEEAAATGHEPADSAPGADALVASGEARQQVRRALAAMPASYREVVFLRDLEGLSTREVARVLDVTEANVKVRLHRAHQRLRRQIGAEAAPSEPSH
jgi:RNA polymerase sigma-70 factor, ECF subfamily